MVSRKVLLVLVEGMSEIKALRSGFTRQFDKEKYEIIFRLSRGHKNENGSFDRSADITSMYGVSPNNITNKLVSEFNIKGLFQEQPIDEKDIAEIIHIVDMDGAYISDEKVVLPIKFEKDKNEKVKYCDDCIIAYDVDGIRERNERKSKNLNFLLGLEKIKIKRVEIAYSIYFFSSNLDQFLYGEANLDSKMKVPKAEEFARNCRNDSDYFNKTFVNGQFVAAGMSYEESWNYIKEGCNSLKRFTNLNILFERYA